MMTTPLMNHMTFIIIIAIGVLHTVVRLCSGAIGDSHLRVSISRPPPFKPHEKGVGIVRLYDPLTDVTYHQSSNPQLIEALGVLWNSVYHRDKCGTVNADFGISNYTRMCDPENIIPKTQAMELRKMIYTIPRVTGCQCDSYQLCNQYDSGFHLFVAVIPTLMKPPANGNNGNNISSLLDDQTNRVKMSTIKATTPAQQTTPSKLIAGVADKQSFQVKATNLVIPRTLSGQQLEIIQEDADIYELLAHYLRALWPTGSCDEDIVICFFPKEKKISLSVGDRLLTKITNCIEDVFVNAAKRLADPYMALTGEESQEQKLIMAELTDEINPGMTRAATLTKRQQKERIRMTTLFKMFVKNVDQLIQSRSDDPCGLIVVKKWSNVEISSFAILSGLGLSIALAILLKLCGLLSDCIDYLLDDDDTTYSSDEAGSDDDIIINNNDDTNNKKYDRQTAVVRLGCNGHNNDDDDDDRNEPSHFYEDPPSPIHLSSKKSSNVRPLPKHDSEYEVTKTAGNTTVTIGPDTMIIERMSITTTAPSLESIIKYSGKPTAV